MSTIKKRCEFCHKWFSPSPYAAHHQKCCSDPVCCKKRKARANKNWRAKNPDYEKGRNEEKRIWAQNYPDYWQKYRQTNSDYVKREYRRRCSARKEAEKTARQDTARQISLEKLKSIQELALNSAARQDAVHGQIEGIVNYLFWKEKTARQDILENQLCKA